MNIYMSAEDEAYVKGKVESGECHSTSEVVLMALELLKERDEVRRWKLERLRCDIQIGLEQADRGEVTPLDIEKIKSEGRKRLAAMQEQH